MSESVPATVAVPRDFLRQVIADDLAAGRETNVITRFPPEPNGYLHIGHAKSITLNFGVAGEFNGRCHLRFDDTNPETEDQHYVDSIIDSVRWLGYDWGDDLYFASDYFEGMYACAGQLIRDGRAYVDGASEEEVREARGTVTRPGVPTPDRDRSIEDNLDLFARMRAGEFPDGAYVLRARIDLASPNMLMRDPVLYRIRHASHYRTGDDWCIYPLYDYAHPLEDAFEGITHSFCTLEFENNREIYDWVVESCPVESRPHQYEFARLALDYTVMSKRRLLLLVKQGHVSGWDDPRMPTIAGLRRRGVTPEAIRAFCDMIGVAKSNSRVDIAKLEYAIRDDLNARAPRVMCVTDPLRVVLTNWPEDRVDVLDAPLWPHDVPHEGKRALPFTREVFIERADFAEDPPKGFRRLVPDGEVRLRHGYIVRCDEVVKDDTGEITELRCTADLESRGGSAPDGRAVKGTIHWVSATQGVPCAAHLYDRLFRVADPDATAEADGVDFTTLLNPDSLVVRAAVIEPAAADADPGTRFQFERLGYFIRDESDAGDGRPVFNRTVTLRDTWARESGAEDLGRPQRKKPEARRPAPSEPTAPPPRSADLERRMAALLRSGMAAADADILTRETATADFFDAAVAAGGPTDGVANWMINELAREAGDRSFDALPFGGPELAALVRMAETGTINSSTAREVLAEMAADGGDPEAIVERRGLAQVSDDAALAPIVDEVLTAHPDRVEAYRGGRTGLLGFFVGQVMGRTGGRANPERVKELLAERLD